MEKMEDMENRNNHKNQETVKTVKTDSAFFSESLKSLKSLMQIFIESAKSAKSIFATFATFASAIFVGKASNESTVRYREWSRIPSCCLRYGLDSNLSRFSLASLICLCMLTVGVGNAWGADTWMLVEDYSTLSTSDTFVIAGNIKGGASWYALKNNRVTSASNLPTVSSTALTISDKKITSTIDANYKWVLESTSTSGVWYIKSTQGSYYLQNADATKSKIDTKSATDGQNQWRIHYAQGTGDNVVTGLWNVGVSRELGCYSNADWRCYTSSNYSNLAGAEVVLYRKTTPCTITWHVNGETTTAGSPTTSSTTGSKVTTLPTAPLSAACDGSKVFVGWTETPIVGTTNTKPSDLFTTAAKAPTLTGNTDYYAVIANQVSAGGASETMFNVTDYSGTPTNWSNYNVTFPSSSYICFDAGGDSLTSPLISAHNSVQVTCSIATYGGATSPTNHPLTVYLLDENDKIIDTKNTATPTSTSYIGSGTLSFGNISHPFKIRFYLPSANRGVRLKAPKCTGTTLPTYNGYRTSCCTALGYIKGSVSWTNGSKAHFSWGAMSNVKTTSPYTSTDPYTVTCINKSTSASAGSITTPARNTTLTKDTCSITGLIAGTTYTIGLHILGASGYCDKDTTFDVIAPKITVKSAPVALTGSDYAEGETGGGTVKTFVVSGVGLTGALTFTAPTNFQVSTDNGSIWSTDGGSKTLAASGTLAETTIKVRLVEGLSEGDYGGATTYVTISGGGAAAVNSSVSIAGSVSSACSAPEVATPTLTSIASGTITPSCASVTVDDNCDVTDYGFVWKASSDPTIDDNQTSVGTSTPASAFSDGLSISFNTGNTYKIKAYAINSAGTTLSSTLTVTPQSVTFNSNGGSSVDTKYVNSGTKVTAPSAPTKTGYDFAGWQLNSSDFDFAKTNVSSDITLDATWNANSYDVTLSSNSGSGSDQTVYATYDDDMPLVIKNAGTDIVVPTKSGYDFGGYYDTDAASGGTQYYTYTGNPKALGSARTWNVANSTTTLYARWIPHQHKVSVSAVDHGTITATPAGGSAISEGSYNATVDYDKTVTLGWTKDDHYNTLVWTVHKDGEESTIVSVTGSGNGATFTMPDYDVVVKATITEDPYTLVTFKNNGTAVSGYEDIKVYSGRPTAPTMTDGHSTGDACDEDSEVFYGWTEDSWEYKISKSAADEKTIHLKGANLPTVTASGDEVVYNAVWAKSVSAASNEWQLVTSTASLDEGDKVVIGHNNTGTIWLLGYQYVTPDVTDSKRYYNRKYASNTETVSDSKITLTSDEIATATGNTSKPYVLTVGKSGDYWTFYDAVYEGYLYAAGNSDSEDAEFYNKNLLYYQSDLTNAGKWSLSINSTTGAATIVSQTTETTKNYLQRNGTTSTGCFSSYGNTQVDPYIFKNLSTTSYSEFMTHCCDKLITLGTPSISNGTITYDWDSPVPTCNSGKTVTATITPSTGYKVTALTFSGGSVSYDDPDFPITSATDVALTFAQNTTAATLSASATTAAIPVTSLSLRAQQSGQDDKTGNDLTMNCYPKEGQTGGNDPLNHTLKVLFEEVLPSNALDKTYDWSVRVKAKDDADWTDVSFTSNTLNTNSIINSFNKSTGNLQIKATEGTAEIKITAHDGSGVTATVTITVTNVALSNLGVSKSSTTLYVGQSEAIDVSYTPLNTTTKGYTTGSYSYVTIGNTNAVLTLTGKAATSEQTETVTLTSKDSGGKTATVTVTVKPLPTAIFVDLIHNKVDFANSGDGWTAGTGVLSSTASEGVVSHTKKTPTHDDLDAPGTGNDCEKTHLHLVGWIRSDYSKVADYLDGTGDVPTVSDLTTAGAGYWFLPNADINVETLNGKIFYAVWATVE